MLGTIIVLAFFSALFEVLIAQKIPKFRRLSGENTLINLIGSMVLSYLTGFAFGATGLIAASAALVSTLMTIPYYKGAKWYYDEGGVAAVNEFRTRWTQLLKDLGKVIRYTVQLITLPIRVARSIHNTAVQLKGHFQ